jgi:hypothetical protein
MLCERHDRNELSCHFIRTYQEIHNIWRVLWRTWTWSLHPVHEGMNNFSDLLRFFLWTCVLEFVHEQGGLFDGGKG